MDGNDVMIKRVFTEEDDLPEIVKRRVREAYDHIYEQVRTQDAWEDQTKAPAYAGNHDKDRGNQSIFRRNGKGLLKVACFMFACMLVLGGTAYAVNQILNRYERMKQMDLQEKEQIHELTQSGGNLVYESSRAWSAEEWARKGELAEAYKDDEIFPEGALKIVHQGEDYSKDEICLIDAEDGKNDILWLPERTLTDEEILEIIEYEEKISFISYENRRSLYVDENPWEKRMESMTDEEVDFYFLAYFTGRVETTGNFSRAGKSDLKGEVVLTEEEKALYLRLREEYLEKNRIPQRTTPLPVIEMPSDFDGSETMLCRYNSCFYFPDRELTEEDFLEVIDFQKRAEYSWRRISDEIEIGKRKDRPRLPDDQTREPEIYEQKAFSEAAKNGWETTIENARIGDVVRFGSYEQDGNLTNGKEEIAWYVLDEAEDYYMLLAQQILDVRPYHEEQKAVTWAECDVRRWLNQEFLETAFTVAEQSHIVNGTVSNEFGGETKDQVYLLSDREVYEYFGIDPESVTWHNKGLSTREIQRALKEALDFLDPRLFAKPTEEAKRRGAAAFGQRECDAYLKYDKVDFSKALGNSAWLHRSARPDLGGIAYVTDPMGNVCCGQYVTGEYGIRPVIRIRR